MTAKKALIVDDSKSARAVLKRMLINLSLEVDTVESAADAIEYLVKHSPDVIFMDHMMPEMDGFEAVKRIKDNPKTHVIPIMMYTSKGGDVYLSQARELGAVGIISKTISPVGLKESLFKLGLVDDRRIKSTLVEGASEDFSVSTQMLATSVLDKKNERDVHIQDLQRLMDDQTIELHKSMWLGIESVSNEIFNKLKAERKEQFENDQQDNLEKQSLSWPFYLVCFLLFVSVLAGINLYIKNIQLEKNFSSLNKNYEILSEQQAITEKLIVSASDLAAAQKSRLGFILWAHGRVIEYPFDELALNNTRIADVEEVINRAQEVGYRGKIILQTHVGKFCLSRNLVGEYVLAKNELPVTECEYIGNDVQPNDAASTHQSLSFANYFLDVAELSEQGILVEVDNLSRIFDIVAYPVNEFQTKAELWNFSAQQNNQVTVKLEPLIAVN
ncbi:MAG: hypothetical protein COA54_10160 [Thiotrichaceae bacterium]|nr:MAG: hypothetical protein COA54_10160 [Thiotrichaceae bacterium]